METVTVSKEEYEQQRALSYNNDKLFEHALKRRMEIYLPCKDNNVKCYERYTKAELMLIKLKKALNQ